MKEDPVPPEKRLSSIEIIDTFYKLILITKEQTETINFLVEQVLRGRLDGMKLRTTMKALDFRRRELDDFKKQFEGSWSGFLKKYHEKEEKEVYE